MEGCLISWSLLCKHQTRVSNSGSFSAQARVIPGISVPNGFPMPIWHLEDTGTVRCSIQACNIKYHLEIRVFWGHECVKICVFTSRRSGHWVARRISLGSALLDSWPGSGLSFSCFQGEYFAIKEMIREIETLKWLKWKYLNNEKNGILKKEPLKFFRISATYWPLSSSWSRCGFRACASCITRAQWGGLARVTISTSRSYQLEPS